VKPLSAIDHRAIRRFGVTATIIFGAATAAGFWRQRPLSAALFCSLASLGVAFWIAPGAMAPVYSSWLRITEKFGQVMTLVVLTLFYYLIITPVAWIRRLTVGRGISLRPDPQAESYWVSRTGPGQDRDRYGKRY
jgi:uncharacterized membrane protein